MDDDAHIALVRSRVRAIPDFPRPGVTFQDITTVLQDRDAWRLTVDRMSEAASRFSPDAIVGVESRGFILGATMAYHLGLGFVPARKPGKLPADTHAISYDLEYGSDSLEMHTDALSPGHRVVIVDDLLATGGTARATIDLVRRCGADVAGLCFLIEIRELGGRATLPADIAVSTLLSY